MNHVLVDYENVHHLNLDLVGSKPVSFVLLLGPKQLKLGSEMIEKLMVMASSVQLVRISVPGKNAVDFALSYYLGQAVLADPAGYFHLVSKDKGYDPLIAHLRDRRIQVRRHESCETLTFSIPGKTLPVQSPAPPNPAPVPRPLIPTPKLPAKKAAAKKPGNPSTKRSLDEMLDMVKTRLENNPKNRPARRKSLLSKIGEVIGMPPEESRVTEIIHLAEKAGWLRFSEKDDPEYRF